MKRGGVTNHKTQGALLAPPRWSKAHVTNTKPNYFEWVDRHYGAEEEAEVGGQQHTREGPEWQVHTE